MEAPQQGAAGLDAEKQSAAAAAARQAAPAAPAAFAKRKSRSNIRKRAAESDDDGAGVDGAVVRKAAKGKDSSMAFTTKRTDRAEVFAFESSGTVQQRQSDATRANEQETAHDRDAR